MLRSKRTALRLLRLQEAGLSKLEDRKNCVKTQSVPKMKWTYQVLNVNMLVGEPKNTTMVTLQMKRKRVILTKVAIRILVLSSTKTPKEERLL